MTPQERNIALHARRFDPVSLIRLLIYMGYRYDDIIFRSHYSGSSQSSLVESIRFRPKSKLVIITLNLGLLGGQSPLPSYFFKKIQSNPAAGRTIIEYLGYFDDRLLRRYLLAIYPEIDDITYPDYEVRKRSEILNLKFDTIVVLHWLMQTAFPELKVLVEKTTLRRTLGLGAIILGKSCLGYQAAFGSKVDIPELGRRVLLITNEERYLDGLSWVHEVEARLKQLVYPLLRKAGLDLEIFLIIREQRSWLQLDQGSYLGYDGIKGGSYQARRICIFSGRLSEL